MCQLLGMNANTPTDLVFSFTGFAHRGGATDEHADGFGVAFFEGRAARIFLDDQPASRSPVAGLVRSYPIRTLNAIAHIRKATHGRVALANCHPFSRELWGRHLVFAHNGSLAALPPAPGRRFRPVGDTDSETAFCHLAEHLAARFDERPDDEHLLDALVEAGEPLARHGTFNLLLGDGDVLVARASTNLCWVGRRHPFAHARLKDEDVTVDFSQLTTCNDRVAVVATSPLTTNEDWTPFEPGQWVMFRGGEPVAMRGR